MLHVDLPEIAELKELAAIRADACVSIYLPTVPRREAANGNRTALKDLVKEATNQLRQTGYDKRRLSQLSEHFGHLLGDDKNPQIEEKVRQRQRLRRKVDDVAEFWIYQSKELGVLATADSMRTFRLPHIVGQLAEVSDRFHLQPLIRAMAMPRQTYVLGLSKSATRLIHVAVDMPPVEIHVPQLPPSLPEGLQVYARAPSINLLLPEYEKVLMQEYVRKVDDALRAVLKGSDLGLILAADEPLASMYRSVNTY